MTMTVVDSLEPRQPKYWEDAAKIVICEIFNSADVILTEIPDFLETELRRMVSSSGEKNDDLEEVLEGLALLQTQFEGMLNNHKFFNSDGLYWVEEWEILGSLAASIGIKNGNLTLNAPAAGHPEMSKSASAGLFDTWMLREEITAVLIRKQVDYGPDNIKRFGRDGLLVRCHDKLARLRNLHLFRAGRAANESLTDTYLDIIGYSAIGIMWERGWFLLPLRSDYAGSD